MTFILYVSLKTDMVEYILVGNILLGAVVHHIFQKGYLKMTSHAAKKKYVGKLKRQKEG